MAKIQLGYGANTLPFEYDEARHLLLAPNEAEDRPLTDVEIGKALDSPIGSAALEEIIQPGETVLIVVSDATRATASAQIVNLLIRRLIQSGISAGDIAIIFATGIHRAPTEVEKRELLTPFIAQRIRTLDHDAYDRASLIPLGRTQRGAPIEVNRALKDFSRVILTGAVGFHYFAGFTGGRKSICPGLASAQTIEATHMLALDLEQGGRRPGVAAGRLDGNAVHEECEEVAAMIQPSFLVNTIVDERGRALRVFAGHWRAAHRLACAEYAATHSLKIDSKRDVVVVSCGGAPYDINMIQAHKALDMAAQACVPGGTIVLLAECADGLGRPDFLKWFEFADSRALELRLRDAYEVNGQTAWSLLTKAENHQVHLVSNLGDVEACKMRLIPARTLEAALSRMAHRGEAFIMPRGSSTLPVSSN
ncbi:MAG: lactate racemase [Blastocatellia bacterium]|jgi:nickel-dependent lactate racemase|nr:lactate racemase [Blastocatellia bacterium]